MNVTCKILMSIFIFGMAWSAVAQEVENPRAELMDKDWFLMKLVMEGEELFFVPNDEIDQSIFLVQSWDDSPYVDGMVTFCHADGFDMILEGNDEFYISGFYVLARYYGDCELTENNDFHNLYFHGFWDNPELMVDNPYGYPYHFQYAINQWEEFEELIVTNDNGDQAFYGNAALSVEQNLFSEVKLYPNPMNDLLFVDQLPEKSKMEIYDVNGKLLISQTLTLENAQIEVSSLSKGIYFYRLSNSANQFKTGKLIKN